MMDAKTRALVLEISDLLMKHVTGDTDAQMLTSDNQVDMLMVISTVAGAIIYGAADSQKHCEEITEGVCKYLTGSAKRWSLLREKENRPEGETIQ